MLTATPDSAPPPLEPGVKITGLEVTDASPVRRATTRYHTEPPEGRLVSVQVLAAPAATCATSSNVVPFEDRCTAYPTNAPLVSAHATTAPEVDAVAVILVVGRIVDRTVDASATPLGTPGTLAVTR